MLASVGTGRSRKASFYRSPYALDFRAHVKALAEMADMSGLRRARPKKAEPNPLDFDLDKRRKWMDEHGVRMHVLTLDGGMPWQWVPPLVGVRLAKSSTTLP